MDGSTPTRWESFSETEQAVLSSALASVTAAVLSAAADGPIEDQEEREAVAGTLQSLGSLHMELERSRGVDTPSDDVQRAVVAAVLNNEYYQLMRAPVDRV